VLLVKLWAPLCFLCVGVVAVGLGAVALSVLEEVAKEFFLLSVQPQIQANLPCKWGCNQVG
jgi:hypothetical protein